MFTACQNKGFQIGFPNGVTVSVQFGPHNYCEHHHTDADYNAPAQEQFWESQTAEVAAFRTDGGAGAWVHPPEFKENFCDGDVIGHLNATRVLEFINACAAMKFD